MLKYYGSLFSWREIIWPASDWAGRIGVGVAAVLAVATLVAARQDESVISAAHFAEITLLVSAFCIGWALLRANHQRLSRLEAELATLRAERAHRLRWVRGRDEYLKERDPTAGNQVIHHRVALDNPSALPVERVKVTVDECSTDQSFVKRMPVRMRDRSNEELATTGITVHPGVIEYPQILEVHYDGSRLLGIYPSVISGLPGHRIYLGEHIITLAATSSGSTITRTFRVTVTNDPNDPVTICPLN